MPGSVTMTEARAQVVSPAETEWTAVVIGCASKSPLAAGALSAVYLSPTTFIADYGYGDGVDLLSHALTQTPAYPDQPPMAFSRAPSTTAGGYGTINNTGVTGTALPANATGVTPLGTYQPAGIVDTGGTIGTDGIKIRWSLDNLRTLSAPIALGTADFYTFPNSEAGFVFGPSTTDLTALNTLINEEFTDFNAHVVLTTGTVHTAADNADVLSAGTYPSATSTATRVARVNAIKAAYNLHRVKGSGATIHINAGGDTTNAVSSANATDDESALTLALEIKTKLNAHDAGTTWHTIADATNTVTSPAPATGTLLAGDYFYTSTTPPTWVAADLYDGSTTPPTGLFYGLAQSSLDFAVVAIAEPVAAGDVPTLTAAMNYLAATFGKRVALLVRFRDPTSGETYAAYETAYAAFEAAIALDDRIGICAGSCWLTDAVTARRYFRSFIPAVFKRAMSYGSQAQEKLARNFSAVADGPLEGVSLVDDSGNLIGYDAQEHGGIEAAHGIALFRIPNQQFRAGAYVASSPVLRPNTSNILLWPDRRVADAMERVAVSISWESIGDTAIYDPATLLLDPDMKGAIEASIREELSRRFATEIQNPDDPLLVAISPTVAVSGADVTISGTINPLFFGYIRKVALTFSAKR